MTTTQAPEHVQTDRMTLRRPLAPDARAIFERYAADPEVTRYLAWPRHRSITDSDVFVGFSDGEWQRWGCGPYLAFSRDTGELLGSTGLAFESRNVASTGYVFARDAWGHGYATESLHAMIDLAQTMGIGRLYAICHVEHHASRRVMEKCGLTREGVLPRHTVFPNLGPGACDVLCYSIALF
jgi:[ribosomal protein S5]-alanine N-acetyltransferase